MQKGNKKKSIIYLKINEIIRKCGNEERKEKYIKRFDGKT
jgi:hypothetical protein